MEESGCNKVRLGRAIVIVIALLMILPVSLVITGNEPSATPEIQDTPEKNFYDGNTEIRLAAAAFDITEGPQNLPDELQIDSYDSRVDGYYIVQFNDAVKELWKARLHQLGATVCGYIPYNAFIVKMSNEAKAQVENLDFVQYVGIYQPAYKTPTHLASDISLRNDLHVADALDFINYENLWQQATLIGEGEKIPVSIMVHEGENPYNVAALILKSGGDVLDISETGNTVRAEVSTQGIQVLSFLNDVEYIMPYYMPEKCLATANVWEQTKSGSGTPVWDQGLHGEGIIVGIADTGLDTDHEVFFDPAWAGPPDWTGPSPSHRKVISYEQWADDWVDASASQHGTKVVANACGNQLFGGSGNPNGWGMAYEAKVSFHDVGASDDTLRGIPNDMKDLFQIMYDDGAILSSCSWSTLAAETFGTYDVDALNSDWFMWDNKDFLVFFSAGGSRTVIWNTTINTPSTAKNGVSVGAHQSDASWNNMEGYSSWGPTYGPGGNPTDGRLKPDLCSDGSTTSATGDGNRDGNIDTSYQSMSGTTIAAPLAMGDGALVAQYYKDGYWPVTPASPVAANGFSPSAALIKASLINGARWGNGGNANQHDYILNGHLMGYPNNDQGWGMTDVDDSLYFFGENREMEVDDNQVGLLTDQYREYELWVDGGPLEISLVWTDYKGSVATFGSLVNDLDMTVTAPNGVTTYYGNNYGSSSRESDSTNPAGYDHVNNVECVLVDSPATGVWTINVSAVNIPIGPQPYALVLTGNFGDNYGWVKFDKHVYNNADTVQIEVKDTDESGSVPVTLMSSTGDSETITLSEAAANARRFTGTITTVMSHYTAENGEISIEDDGWIRAFYNETVPMHSSSCIAATELTNPMIWNVHVTDITNTAAIVHWNTDLPATSQVYYGETVALGSSTPFNGDMVFSHSVAITGLTGFTNYYFDVESTSLGGVTTRDDFGGEHYMFTTVDNPDVMIVQEHSDVESSDIQVNDWRLSLDFYGWSYTVWETVKYGLPSVSDLNIVKVVYWDTGEGYPQLGADERALIQTWVNQPGKQLWYQTGQDVAWDMSPFGTDTDLVWLQTYLHCNFDGDDADGGGGNEGPPPFQIVGTTHSISSTFPGNGVGQDLEQDVYGPGRFWPDDITNNCGGQVPAPWDYNRHAHGGDCGGIAYEDANYKLAYEAFAHCMIQDDGTYGTAGNVFGVDLNMDRATIADQTLIWLFGEDHPGVTVIDPNGGETVSATHRIDWTIANANSIDIQISRDGGQSYLVEATGLPGGTTFYDWDTTTSGTYGPGLDFPNGEFYRVKVIGYGAILKGFDISDANFTVQNLGGDDEGPVIWAGSVKPSPIPVLSGNPLNITAIADDRYRGNSNIAQVEYYVDGTSPAELVGDMAPADGFFDSALESAHIDYNTFSLSQGIHTVYVRARDTLNNWGGFESVDFHVIAWTGTPPMVDLSSPDGGEVWMGGSSKNIWWNMSDSFDPITDLIVDLYYSTDGGLTFPSTIATGMTGFPSNPCSFNWDPVPSIDSNQVRVRVIVEDTALNTVQDESMANFTIDSTPPQPATDEYAGFTGTNDLTISWNDSLSSDIDRYEVWYRASLWDPTGDTYSLRADVGLNTSYTAATWGKDNPGTYFFQIRTFDLAGHETRTLIQAGKYQMTLPFAANPSHWWFLGCSLKMNNTSVEYVLQSLIPNVGHVMLYRDGVWLHWDPSWPPSLNTLTDIYQGEAFWAQVNANDRWCQAGQVTDLSIVLKAGWNCVAYPYADNSKTTLDIEIDLLLNCPNYAPGSLNIFDYNQPYGLAMPGGAETLSRGEGLWIMVTADTTWTVINY